MIKGEAYTNREGYKSILISKLALISLAMYTGAGSGLTRAQLYTPNIKFENDERLKEFVVTIWRENIGDNGEVNGGAYGGVDDVHGEDKRLVDNVLVNGRKNDGGGDGEVDGGAERVPYHLLTGQQKNIIQYCSIPRSAREILTHIGYKYHSDIVAKIIRPLVNMGYLEYTIPDKPNSPKQKYRKKQK